MKKNVLDTILLLIGLDMFILFFMLLGVVSGAPVQHIPFWDAQFNFIFGWMGGV